jgi:hypothetical protein
MGRCIGKARAEYLKRSWLARIEVGAGFFFAICRNQAQNHGITYEITCFPMSVEEKLDQDYGLIFLRCFMGILLAF